MTAQQKLNRILIATASNQTSIAARVIAILQQKPEVSK